MSRDTAASVAADPVPVAGRRYVSVLAIRGVWLGAVFVLLTIANALGWTAPLDHSRHVLREWTSAPALRDAVHPLSGFGTWPVAFVVAVALAFVRAPSLGRAVSVAVVLAMALSLVIESALRLDVTNLHLSEWKDLLLDPAGTGVLRSSFPSGHMTRLTILLLFALPLVPARSRLVVALVALAVAVINRLQWSDHTVTDLVGGVIFAVALLDLSERVLRRASRRANEMPGANGSAP